MVLVVKNLPANAGDRREKGEFEPLEEGMAAHSSILAWGTPWTWGRRGSDATERLSLHDKEYM